MGTLRDLKAQLRRPVTSPDVLVWGVSIYTTVVFNAAFWRAIAVADMPSGAREWLSWVCMGLIMVAINVLLVRLLCTRWTIRAVLTAFILLATVLSFFSDHYGVHFDVGMVRNMLATDIGESKELATWGLASHVLAYGLPPLLLVLGLRIRWPGVGASAARAMGSVLIALVLLVGAAAVGFKDIAALMRNHREIRHLVVPANIVASVARVLAKDGVGRYGGPRSVVAPDARLALHGPAVRPHALVIVVGETVRAENWGLNGYARQTTPMLSKQDLVNFSDVSACGSSTEVSLPCMFSAYGRGGYDEDKIARSESLLHVLARADVDVGWRDNQGGCKGVCAGLPFESMRERRDDGLCTDQGCMDQVLLTGLKERIESSPGDVVMVLHQLGNHGPSYFLRYPDRLRVFRPDCRNPDLGACTRAEVVNAYDNAVLATDEMVASTIELLKRVSTHDSAMIYLSDHGESLGEKNLYLHGLPHAIAPDTQIKVPMVAWISPGFARWRGLDRRCLAARARLPASHDNLFHSVLGLMQVGTSAYQPGKDVFNGCLRP